MKHNEGTTSAVLVYEIEAMDEQARLSPILIPAERALTLFVNNFEIVTLMTLGASVEALAIGYLRNQHLIRSCREIESIHIDWDAERLDVVTFTPIANLAARTSRRVVTTGCGQGTVFGSLMEDIRRVSVDTKARIRQSVIYWICDHIRNHPSIYKKARSVHACALFSNAGQLQYFVEDVGRHNAVDAIAGHMAMDELLVSDSILYTTGRLTSEMVIKCGQMNFPFLMSRSGTTEMGRQVALDLGITLLSRCTGTHFLAVTHANRVLLDSQPT